MEINYNLKLEQKQQLNMTPQLRMAIKLLQYSTLDLKEYIEKLMDENPLLELEGVFEPIDNSNYISREDGPGFEKYTSEKESLYDHLEAQLYQVLAVSELGIGRYIIGNLDDQGFLSVAVDDISARFAVSKSQVIDIIHKIQSLDPPGIAASDYRESLLIQLNLKYEDTELESLIVERYLPELAAGQLELIAEELNLNITLIDRAVRNIKDLNPYPASGYYQGEETRYITPDLIIEKLDDKFVLEDNSIIPEIKINQYYYNLIKKADKIEEVEYLKKKYQQATWLIRSIEQRRRTIYKISEVIIDRQKDFLNKGIKYLYTMTLNDVAEAVGVHESTVSRAVKEKYLQTPQGLFELKFFFNSGVEEISARSIQAYIMELVRGEDLHSPYSDKKIAKLLKEKLDINISRRTVAKYRNKLGLPASSKRRRR